MAANPRRAPTAVAVFGGGTVGMLAAAAIARCLPGSGVSLVETPLDRAALTDFAHTGHPSLARLNARLGLVEQEMLRRADATHRLMIRYRGWRRDAVDWCVGYGAVSKAAVYGLIESFPQALSAPHGCTSPAAAIAARGRFAAPSDDPHSALSDIDYALRFDPARYREGLSALIKRHGITRLHGDPAALIRTEAGAVARVVLHDGRQVEADIYVDATGPAAKLLDLAGLQERHDWSARLAADRLMVAELRDNPALCLTDTVEALPGGWRFHSPGRDATRVGLAYHSATTSDEQARQLLLPTTGTARLAVHPVEPGRLTRPFRHNVVALGDAAAAFEPLAWCNLHLAVVSIELLIELLPGCPIEPLERDEYNRRWGMLADRTADYVAAHYIGPMRQSPFWRRAATLERSAGLALTGNEFARRGRLPIFEEEAIPRDQWLQLLLGSAAPAAPGAELLAICPARRLAMAQAEIRRLESAIDGATPYSQIFPQLLQGAV